MASVLFWALLYLVHKDAISTSQFVHAQTPTSPTTPLTRKYKYLLFTNFYFYCKRKTL